MLENLESFIVHHRRILQALFFGFVTTCGLLLYANANNFQTYTAPQRLPLYVLALTTLLIFCSFYIIETTTATSQTSVIMLGVTLLALIVSAFQLPFLVNLVNGLLLVTLCLLRFLPHWFLNEWGIITFSLLIATLAAGNFLIRHDYLSLSYLTTMILPFLSFNYFLMPKKMFQNKYYPLVVGLLLLGWLLFSQRSWLLTLEALILLSGWLLLKVYRDPSPSKGLLVASILQMTLLILSR